MFRRLTRVAATIPHIYTNVNRALAVVPRKTKLEKLLFNQGTADFSEVKLVTFDVTGTLINFSAPIGLLYAHAIADLGIHTDPERLSAAFPVAIRDNLTKNPLFGRDTMATREWWRLTVLQTFHLAGYDLSPMMSTVVFDKVYSLFGSPEAYSVVESAHDTIRLLRDHNILVGIVTNSDERYQDSILPMLGLDFDFAVSSRIVGANKPSSLLFAHALEMGNELYKAKQRLNMDITSAPPLKKKWVKETTHDKLESAIDPASSIPDLKLSECVHIGNDYLKDVRPAGECGWTSVLVGDGSLNEEEVSKYGVPTRKAYRCESMMDVLEWVATSLKVDLEYQEEEA